MPLNNVDIYGTTFTHLTHLKVLQSLTKSSSLFMRKTPSTYDQESFDELAIIFMCSNCLHS
ncbi:hypothetical protein Csa_023501 [Cucumis sativus]|uniref:Uncharacterized protein n=1 Tax=Cucumis sativus TaxID=3659 RepID=A0A0A0LTM4_CUCSA|nr:hypothetical protein Csa_023501 [Cucumis sativus]